MKETLQERLQREADERYGYDEPQNVADDERPYYPPYADDLS